MITILSVVFAFSSCTKEAVQSEVKTMSSSDISATSNPLTYADYTVIYSNNGWHNIIDPSFAPQFSSPHVHIWEDPATGDRAIFYQWDNLTDLDDFLDAPENSCKMMASSQIEEDGSVSHHCGDPGNECAVSLNSSGTASTITCCI